MSRDSAIQAANRALDFLWDEDGLDAAISEHRKLKDELMQPVFERVLTNNQPTGEVEEVDWDSEDLPERLKKLLVYKEDERSDRHQFLACSCSWMTLRDDTGYLLEAGLECYLSTPERDCMEVASYWGTVRLPDGASEIYFAIGDTVEDPAPWSDNKLFKLNFVRDDLKDLYEGGEEGCLPLSPQEK